MDCFEAKRLAVSLMEEHGLEFWNFRYNSAKRIFGTCNQTTRTITLSIPLVRLNDEARVKNTILHEIAHALVGVKHGHDWIWKQKALEIGCTGDRCFSVKDTVVPRGNWEAVCEGCGHVHSKIKTPKVIYGCGICRKRGKKTTLEFKRVVK